MERYNWAELGGVLLHGSPPDPSVHFRGLMLSKLNGWRGLPGARGSNDSVPGGHGTYPADKVLRDERSMELKGAAVGDDPAAASTLLAQLETACGDRIVQLRVSDDTGVWSRMVEIEAFQPAEDWNRPRVPFTIDMIAPDPVRYSDILTAGPALLPVQVGGLVFPAAFPWDFGTFDHAKAVVTNTGSLPILPRIIIESLVPDGPVFADSITVFAGPRRLEFGPFSGRLVFDALERRAWLNGVDVTRQIIRREWPVVGPGETQEFYFEAVNPSPNISLSCEYRIGVW